MVVLHLDTPMAGAPGPGHRGRVEPRWTCALVNNMPDGAFVHTEGQFLDLLDIGSGNEGVDVRLYTMPGVARGETTGKRIAEFYTPMSDLFDHPPEVLIVTGSNPDRARTRGRALLGRPARAAHLGQRERPVHAAVLPVGPRRPGRLRRHRPDQPCRPSAPASSPRRPTRPTRWPPGSAGPSSCPTRGSTPCPHGEPPGRRLRGGPAVGGGGTGAWPRRVDRSQVVCSRPIPSTAPSLLREYQRDVRRYAGHERDELPCLPSTA
jgi:homoserine O-succinyltransferase